MGVYFCDKSANSQFFDNLGGPNGLTHKYKPRPKIKNPLSHIGPAYKVLSKMVCHIPVAPMITEEIYF